MEIWNGGRDGKTGGIDRASKTGYYLKKFLVDNLDLSQNQTARHAWIYFRYAEVLLNYAEAVNEAYNFDVVPPGYPMTARAAVDMVRSRVSMPAIEATNREELREKIKHERRIELAFEGHRFWDIRRWDLKEVMSSPVNAMRIDFSSETPYSIEFLENRPYQDYMIYGPVPYEETLKYDIVQNLGWQ